jgi:2-amino-4-hydroxy-6-hydroxymethyldihydropteridine diphosphokinase
MSVRVFIGLGANIGNRRANLLMALRMLARDVRIDAVSSLYESPALVPEGTSAAPDFYNAVCGGETQFAAEELLTRMKDIEREIGRRPAVHWAPRPIDLDLLLFGDQRIDIEAIKVPHPAMCDRAFVLVPLAEIAPAVVHPLRVKRIDELAAAVDRAELRLVAGPEWASD